MATHAGRQRRRRRGCPFTSRINHGICGCQGFPCRVDGRERRRAVNPRRLPRHSRRQVEIVQSNRVDVAMVDARRGAAPEGYVAVGVQYILPLTSMVPRIEGCPIPQRCVKRKINQGGADRPVHLRAFIGGDDHTGIESSRRTSFRRAKRHVITVAYVL